MSLQDDRGTPDYGMAMPGVGPGGAVVNSPARPATDARPLIRVYSGGVLVSEYTPQPPAKTLRQQRAILDRLRFGFTETEIRERDR